MKIVFRIMEYIGVAGVMVGGCAMDSPSIIVPLLIAFGGLAIAFIGWRGENEYV